MRFANSAKSVKILAAGLAVCSAVLLTGCGGGGGVSADVVVTPTGPAFEIGAQVNGVGVPNFDVEPSESQTISISNGSTFEFDSNDDVYWTVYVNGSQISGTNNAIIVGDATLTETLTNGTQFAGYITSSTPLPAPIQVTLVATSQFDNTQTAQINLMITN